MERVKIFPLTPYTPQHPLKKSVPIRIRAPGAVTGLPVAGKAKIFGGSMNLVALLSIGV
jgi:hypothetical protein